MLWLLIALCVVNVVLAVWRPKMMIKVSQSVYKATSNTHAAALRVCDLAMNRR